MAAKRGRNAVGNTKGGRGRLPGGMTTMGDYYRSGRRSALAPKSTVRGADGKPIPFKGAGGAKS